MATKDLVEISIVGKVAEKSADLQRKIITPTKETQVVTPDEGYYGLSEVIVSPPTIDGDEILKAVNNTNTLLSESYVGGDAKASEILEGKTAYVKGKKVEGTIEKYNGVTDIEISSGEEKDVVLLTQNALVDKNINIKVKSDEVETPYFYFKRLLYADKEDYPYKIMSVIEKNLVSNDKLYFYYSPTSTVNINTIKIGNKEKITITNSGKNELDASGTTVKVYNPVFQLEEEFYYAITYCNTLEELKSIIGQSRNIVVAYIDVMDDCYRIPNIDEDIDMTHFNLVNDPYLRYPIFRYFNNLIYDYGEFHGKYRLKMPTSDNNIYIYAKNFSNRIIEFEPDYLEEYNKKYNGALKYIYIPSTNNGFPVKGFIFPFPTRIAYSINNSSDTTSINLASSKYQQYNTFINLDLYLNSDYYYNIGNRMDKIQPNFINIKLFNIGVNLLLGQTGKFGDMLTYESIIHTIRQLINVGSSRILTIGTINKRKIADTYVKLIEITADMLDEDEFVAKKKPFAICESTDEGAMTIDEYVALKNWKIA